MFILTLTGCFVCFFELVQGWTSSTRAEFIRANKGIINLSVKFVSLVPCVYCSATASQLFTVLMCPWISMFFLARFNCFSTQWFLEISKVGGTRYASDRLWPFSIFLLGSQNFSTNQWTSPCTCIYHHVATLTSPPPGQLGFWLAEQMWFNQRKRCTKISTIFLVYL